MTVTQFLLDRLEEQLDSLACRRAQSALGRPVCLCEEPTEDVVRVLDRISLVHFCEASRGGSTFLRTLADAYATHPDYQPEWHDLSR